MILLCFSDFPLVKGILANDSAKYLPFSLGSKGYLKEDNSE